MGFGSRNLRLIKIQWVILPPILTMLLPVTTNHTTAVLSSKYRTCISRVATLRLRWISLCFPMFTIFPVFFVCKNVFYHAYDHYKIFYFKPKLKPKNNPFDCPNSLCPKIFKFPMFSPSGKLITQVSCFPCAVTTLILAIFKIHQQML